MDPMPFSPMHKATMEGMNKHEPGEKMEGKKGKGANVHTPHIHIHQVGKSVHVHVMHHNKEDEHHEHDKGDPAIADHVIQHFGGDEQQPEERMQEDEPMGNL